MRRPSNTSALYWLLGGVAVVTAGCYVAPMGETTEVAIDPDMSPEQIDMVLQAVDEINIQIGRQVLKPLIGRGLINHGVKRITVNNNTSKLSPNDPASARAYYKVRGCAIRVRPGILQPSLIKHELMHCFGYKHVSSPETDLMYWRVPHNATLPPRIVEDFKRYTYEVYDYDNLDAPELIVERI